MCCLPWWLAAVGLICMLIGYLYTGGPIPISSTPFGELSFRLHQGYVIILIAYFIQTDHVSSTVAIEST